MICALGSAGNPFPAQTSCACHVGHRCRSVLRNHGCVGTRVLLRRRLRVIHFQQIDSGACYSDVKCTIVRKDISVLDLGFPDLVGPLGKTAEGQLTLFLRLTGCGPGVFSASGEGTGIHVPGLTSRSHVRKRRLVSYLCISMQQNAVFEHVLPRPLPCLPFSVI